MVCVIVLVCSHTTRGSTFTAGLLTEPLQHVREDEKAGKWVSLHIHQYLNLPSNQASESCLLCAIERQWVLAELWAFQTMTLATLTFIWLTHGITITVHQHAKHLIHYLAQPDRCWKLWKISNMTVCVPFRLNQNFNNDNVYAAYFVNLHYTLAYIYILVIH